jgi:aspartate dehydrogenase
MDSKIKVGIIGCGFIGSEMARAVQERFKDIAQLGPVCEIDKARKEAFDKTVGFTTKSVSMLECIEASDLIVEAAVADVVPNILRHATMLKRDLLIMSVGGLYYEPGLLEEVRKKGIHLFVSSGAIGGIDLLKAANVGKIYSVQLTTKKPVEALRGAPFFQEHKVDLDSVLGEKLIFEGKASDAIRYFPQNVNVAATLSLAGIGPERTRVNIVTSRTLKKNVHEIAIEGEFGRAVFLMENEPSRSNPKTSQLAANAGIATLEKILYGIEIGT